MENNNISFAYFAEIITQLDIDILENYAVSTIPDTKNRIIIDLDNEKIIIGARNVA